MVLVVYPTYRTGVPVSCLVCILVLYCIGYPVPWWYWYACEAQTEYRVYGREGAGFINLVLSVVVALVVVVLMVLMVILTYRVY